MQLLVKSLGALVLFSAQSSWAISNVEADKPRLPNEGFSGAVGLSAEGKKGNQEKQAFSGSSRLNFRQEDTLLLLLLAQDYGSKNKVRDDRSQFAHLRWTNLLTEKLATEVFTQWETEEFDYLKSRKLAGAGLRYFVGYKPDAYLCALGLGAFKEREVNDLITYIDEQNLSRINAYYSLKLQINNQLSLVNTIYAQPNIDDFSDYRVLFDLTLSSKITDYLAFSLAYRLRHDSQPAQNLAATPPIMNHSSNMEYKSGLTYSF
jgi:putative salt-induced outer membrane protein YdiY